MPLKATKISFLLIRACETFKKIQKKFPRSGAGPDLKVVLWIATACGLAMTRSDDKTRSGNKGLKTGLWTRFASSRAKRGDPGNKLLEKMLAITDKWFSF